MNKPKYVFAQLVAFLDDNKFRHIVDKYDGNRYVKHFTCWNQLLTLMFGQLSNRKSLRDLIIAIEAQHPLLLAFCVPLNGNWSKAHITLIEELDVHHHM